MSNYMTPALDYTAVPSYPAANAPQVVIPWEPKSITIQNESATGDVFVSFDGVNDHMHLTPGQRVTTALTRVQKIWFRSGTTGTTGLRVWAEG